MFKFLKRLLGSSKNPPAVMKLDPGSPESSSLSDLGGEQDGGTTDDYYGTMGELQLAVSKREYERAARLARVNLRQLPALVESWKQEYGSFDIRSIPALEVGGTMLALFGDDEGLAEMSEVVNSHRDLQPWIETTKRHREDRRLFEAILQAVRKNPGCLQTDTKSLVGADDGRRVSTLISWLDKAGEIIREKQGRTYSIWVTEAERAPVPPPKRIMGSHRTDRDPPRMREIDVTRIPYVPLPRSPSKWEEAQMRGAATAIPDTTGYFEVRDAAEWEIGEIESIPPDERPDTAFRQLCPVGSGLLMIDDLGNAQGLGQIPAAALRYGRAGELSAKKPLLHDVYRIHANPMGRGLIAMSKECVVHAYDDALDLTLETTLCDAPEIRAISKRFQISGDQLKNHVRCVALSRDASRYIFTVVDEAWCVGMDGRGLWGAKLPVKDGWAQIAEPSEASGTSDEIQAALSLIGMSYPFAPEDIKKRYRQLAKDWHPDLHPGDPTATERMKALTLAVQLLTGIDATSLPAYTGVRYGREIDRSEVDLGGGVKLTITTSQTVDESFAADWIYAASFGGWSNSVFLAGYSGRVVVLTDDGDPVRAYAIGAVPRRIVDTGDYLYILTDTRLYVLRGQELCTIVDTFDVGNIVVAQTGFGLLEKKRFRWFREDGRYLGGIVAHAPIRRVYSKPGGMSIATRTHRANVLGVPAWWEESA